MKDDLRFNMVAQMGVGLTVLTAYLYPHEFILIKRRTALVTFLATSLCVILSDLHLQHSKPKLSNVITSTYFLLLGYTVWFFSGNPTHVKESMILCALLFLFNVATLLPKVRKEFDMVPRCGYYTTDNAIERYVTSIEWNLGFDIKAKHAYVTELHSKLKERFPTECIIEVTSACADEFGRALSPIFVTFDNSESLEDAWSRLKKNKEYIGYSNFRWPNPAPHVTFVHYYCYYAQHMLPLIRLIDVFTDVFYNPSKDGSTQAEACAVLKLLDKQGKLSLLNNMKDFIEWYEEYIKWR